MQHQIKLALQKALQGSSQVMITFKHGPVDRNVIHGIAYLLGMAEVGYILLSEKTQLALRALLRSRKWVPGVGINPTIITLTSKFDARWFMERMHRAIEKIEVVKNKIEVVDINPDIVNVKVGTANN